MRQLIAKEGVELRICGIVHNACCVARDGDHSHILQSQDVIKVYYLIIEESVE